MDVLQPTLAVMLVLGLLAATLWWLRRRGLAQFSGLPRRRTGGLLEPVERLALSPGHILHLVRVGDRAVLLATSPGGCRLVETLPWTAIDANRNSPTSHSEGRR